MTDYETLAALGLPEAPAKPSEAASLAQRNRPDALPATPQNVEFPSRRSLRGTAGPVGGNDLPAGLAPAQPGSRRAAREARAAADPAPSIPVAQNPLSPVRLPAVEAPAVAAPFGMFDERPVAEARPAVAAAAARPNVRSTSVRKRLSVAGTMVLVGGLFVSLTLPAYASTGGTDGLLQASAKLDGQTLALAASDVDSASLDQARDGYESTSAADLKRLYRDALKQQRMSEYAASGAMAMGDDYPWATELGMGQGGGLSPLRYFVRQCTDFVAWRLNRDAGSTKAPFKYDWSYLTPGGGSAHSWKSQWEKHGWAVSTTPAPGWVAWFPGGNHVAYVNSVLADGSVFIEEYNWGADVYNQRIIPAGGAIYLAPPPR